MREEFEHKEGLNMRNKSFEKTIKLCTDILHSVQTLAYWPQVKKGLGLNRSWLNIDPSSIV